VACCSGSAASPAGGGALLILWGIFLPPCLFLVSSFHVSRYMLPCLRPYAFFYVATPRTCLTMFMLPMLVLLLYGHGYSVAQSIPSFIHLSHSLFDVSFPYIKKGRWRTVGKAARRQFGRHSLFCSFYSSSW
jgi:hypothetical protein